MSSLWPVLLLVLTLGATPALADPPGAPSRAPAAVAPPSRSPSTEIPRQQQAAAAAAPAPAQSAAPQVLDASTAPDTRGAQQERLSQALLAIEPELGHLEPWQKQIFTEEAAPQAQRFIKNYTGSTADVDFDALRNFLHFHAPELLRRVDGKVLGLVKVDPTCPKCVQSKEQIKAEISERVRRRGLDVTWLTTEDLTAPALPERELEDKLVQLANTAADGPVGAIP